MKKKVKDHTHVKDHVLVPKHTKLSDKDKKALLKQYTIKLHNLPKLSQHDPAIQHLSTQPGDIIKIERTSPTAGKIIFYRVILDD